MAREPRKMLTKKGLILTCRPSAHGGGLRLEPGTTASVHMITYPTRSVAWPDLACYRE